MKIILTTERLVLRELNTDDAAFIFELLNEPAWLEYIGDKGIHNLDDARNYIVNGPMAMYEKHGFGLFAVEHKDNHSLLGLCGLIKRDSLEDVDIGFAFLTRYHGNNYACEAAKAILAYAQNEIGLHRVVAIVSPENQRSNLLLKKIGLTFEKLIQLDPAAKELNLLGWNKN